MPNSRTCRGNNEVCDDRPVPRVPAAKASAILAAFPWIDLTCFMAANRGSSRGPVKLKWSHPVFEFSLQLQGPLLSASTDIFFISRTDKLRLGSLQDRRDNDHLLLRSATSVKLSSVGSLRRRKKPKLLLRRCSRTGLVGSRWQPPVLAPSPSISPSVSRLVHGSMLACVHGLVRYSMSLDGGAWSTSSAPQGPQHLASIKMAIYKNQGDLLRLPRSVLSLQTFFSIPGRIIEISLIHF